MELAPQLLLDGFGRGEGEAGKRHVPKAAGIGLAQGGLHPRDRRGAHGQLGEPQAHEEQRLERIRRHFTAPIPSAP